MSRTAKDIRPEFRARRAEGIAERDQARAQAAEQLDLAIELTTVIPFPAHRTARSRQVAPEAGRAYLGGDAA